MLWRWPRITSQALRGGGLAVCALVVVWSLLPLLPAEASVTVLDVGQGDAILVRDGCACVLVDAGPQGAAAQALARQQVRHLDAIVITHLHDDHYGGVLDLAGSCAVDHIYVPEGAQDQLPPELSLAVSELGLQGVEELSYGDALTVGSFELVVISPTEAVEGTSNEDSLELACSYDVQGRELSALLTGDAESEVTDAAIARGDVGDIDLLKVGHHGSASSISAEGLAVLKPELAVASAGAGNSYGHPNKTCIERLEDAGSLFVCTISAGDVTVYPGETGPRVLCQRALAAQGDVA